MKKYLLDKNIGEKVRKNNWDLCHPVLIEDIAYFPNEKLKKKFEDLIEKEKEIKKYEFIK